MTVIPFKATPRKWDEKEVKIFIDMYNIRTANGKLCEYIMGETEEGWPYFSLFAFNGDGILHISRGKNGVGYILMSSTRKTAYVGNIDELFRGFGLLEEGFVANTQNVKKN